MNWVTFNFVFMYVFVTLRILQSQFIEKGFKKTENSEQNVVLLLFLFTLVCYAILLFWWKFLAVLWGCSYFVFIC